MPTWRKARLRLGRSDFTFTDCDRAPLATAPMTCAMSAISRTPRHFAISRWFSYERQSQDALNAAGEVFQLCLAAVTAKALGNQFAAKTSSCRW